MNYTYIIEWDESWIGSFYYSSQGEAMESVVRNEPEHGEWIADDRPGMSGFTRITATYPVPNGENAPLTGKVSIIGLMKG